MSEQQDRQLAEKVGVQPHRSMSSGTTPPLTICCSEETINEDVSQDVVMTVCSLIESVCGTLSSSLDLQPEQEQPVCERKREREGQISQETIDSVLAEYKEPPRKVDELDVLDQVAEVGCIIIVSYIPTTMLLCTLYIKNPHIL